MICPRHTNEEFQGDFEPLRPSPPAMGVLVPTRRLGAPAADAELVRRGGKGHTLVGANPAGLRPAEERAFRRMALGRNRTVRLVGRRPREALGERVREAPLRRGVSVVRHRAQMKRLPVRHVRRRHAAPSGKSRCRRSGVINADGASFVWAASRVSLTRPSVLTVLSPRLVGTDGEEGVVSTQRVVVVERRRRVQRFGPRTYSTHFPGSG
jgi:hypothetical protein